MKTDRFSVAGLTALTSPSHLRPRPLLHLARRLRRRRGLKYCCHFQQRIRVFICSSRQISSRENEFQNSSQYTSQYGKITIEIDKLRIKLSDVFCELHVSYWLKRRWTTQRVKTVVKSSFPFKLRSCPTTFSLKIGQCAAIWRTACI